MWISYNDKVVSSPPILVVSGSWNFLCKSASENPRHNKMVNEWTCLYTQCACTGTLHACTPAYTHTCTCHIHMYASTSTNSTCICQYDQWSTCGITLPALLNNSSGGPLELRSASLILRGSRSAILWPVI